MEVLWERSPQTASALIQVLAPREGWRPNTVKTMLSRLVGKRALMAEPRNNLFWYSPALSRDEVVKGESESFVERVFGGAMGAALLHFVSHQRLSPKEVRELKRILDDSTKPRNK